MSKCNLTPAQVEAEIEKLKCSEFVKLSQKEQRIKADKRRKCLADLRWHEKRGKELAAAGITLENIRALMEAMDEQPFVDCAHIVTKESESNEKP